MPAKHHIDNKAKLIITEWEGDVIDIDLIDAIKKYQKDIQSNPDYLYYNEVIDFSNAASIKLSTKGIISIGQIASSTDHREINKKLAIIVNSKLAFGLTRMYLAYRSIEKNANKEARIFKKADEAYEWLQSNT